MTIRDDFAGPGGWDVATNTLDLGNVIGVENDAAAVATGRAAGHRREHADVKTMRSIKRYRGGLTGYIASPPCQTFSAAGKGAGRHALDSLLLAVELVAKGDTPEDAVARTVDTTLDARSVLVLEPLHVIATHRPQWVALEQVPPVLPVWEAYAEVLRTWGYNVATGHLQAEQYGVPQTRRRAVLMAHQDRQVQLPTPTHSRFHTRDRTRLDVDVAPWVSIRQAFRHAALPLPGDEIRSNYGTGGDPAARGVRTVDDPCAAVTTKVGRNRWQYVGGPQANATRRDLNEPAGTVFSQRTANMAWGQAGMDRADSPRVTVQEAGVLQSFPADYPWRGISTQQYQQVGNAIPPLLAHAILRGLIA